MLISKIFNVEAHKVTDLVMMPLWKVCIGLIFTFGPEVSRTLCLLYYVVSPNYADSVVYAKVFEAEKGVDLSVLEPFRWKPRYFRDPSGLRLYARLSAISRLFEEGRVDHSIVREIISIISCYRSIIGLNFD